MAPPPAKPKGKLGGKVAGVPVPVLIAAGAVLAIVAFVYFRRGSGGTGTLEASGVLSGGQIGPQMAASSGQPSSNGAPADQLSPDVLDALNGLGTTISGLSSDLALFVASQPAPSEAPAAVQAAASGQATAAMAPTPAPAQTAAQKQTNTPQPAAGVLWGGQVFTTKSALASWLSARGATYATWAANHPDAAKKLR